MKQIRSKGWDKDTVFSVLGLGGLLLVGLPVANFGLFLGLVGFGCIFTYMVYFLGREGIAQWTRKSL